MHALRRLTSSPCGCLISAADFSNPFHCFRCAAAAGEQRTPRTGSVRLRRLLPCRLLLPVPSCASLPPFHCSHAFTVTHTAWRFLELSEVLQSKLQDIDRLARRPTSAAAHAAVSPLHSSIFTSVSPPASSEANTHAPVRRPVVPQALLLSTVCHDLEHPGTTNAFQVANQTKLALLHNDRQVLENHHANVAWRLIGETQLLAAFDAPDAKARARAFVKGPMSVSNCFALSPVPPQPVSPFSCSLPAQTLRKLMIDAILHTDMALHKDHVSRAQRKAEEGLPETLELEDRQLLVTLLVHSADLCNPTLEPPLSRRLAESVSAEFEAQAAVERASGQPVTVMLAGTPHLKAAQEVRGGVWTPVRLYALR